MASVFSLLEAFNRKEAAALGFFPCATASLFSLRGSKKENPHGGIRHGGSLLVRKMGLEPTRHRHTHLKRACLPIPALPHKAMPWHCQKYFSIPAAKTQGLFGLFFKLLTTVPSRAKIVRYTASFTPFSRMAANTISTNQTDKESVLL